MASLSRINPVVDFESFLILNTPTTPTTYHTLPVQCAKVGIISNFSDFSFPPFPKLGTSQVLTWMLIRIRIEKFWPLQLPLPVLPTTFSILPKPCNQTRKIYCKYKFVNPSFPLPKNGPGFPRIHARERNESLFLNSKCRPPLLPNISSLTAVYWVKLIDQFFFNSMQSNHRRTVTTLPGYYPALEWISLNHFHSRGCPWLN